MALATATVLNRSFVVALLLGAALLPSCLFVKAPDKKPPIVEHADLSPLPNIVMGDELVRSSLGDMISLLPANWVLLDPGTSTSNDVLVVAVNPDYTVSAVFSAITGTSALTGAVNADGLLGLARTAYGIHQRKSGGSVKLVDSYAIDTLGTRLFGTYSFAPTAGIQTRCAVFTSTLGNHYEFALVPLSISAQNAPSPREMDQLFTSIMATIQF